MAEIIEGEVVSGGQMPSAPEVDGGGQKVVAKQEKIPTASDNRVKLYNEILNLKESGFSDVYKKIGYKKFDSLLQNDREFQSALLTDLNERGFEIDPETFAGAYTNQKAAMVADFDAIPRQKEEPLPQKDEDGLLSQVKGMFKSVYNYTKEPIEDLYKFAKRGFSTGLAGRGAQAENFATGTVDTKNLAEYLKKANEVGTTRIEAEFAQDEGLLKDTDDLIGILIPSVVESFANMAGAGYKKILGITGAGAVGGAAVGGLPGAAIGGGRALQGAMLQQGYNLEFVGTVIDELATKKLVNLDADVKTIEKQLNSAFANKDLMGPIFEKANTRAAAITATDFVLSGMGATVARNLAKSKVAGRVMNTKVGQMFSDLAEKTVANPVYRKAARLTNRAAQIDKKIAGSKLGRAGVTVGVQDMFGGAAGETIAQALTQDELDWKSIAVEAGAEGKFINTLRALGKIGEKRITQKAISQFATEKNLPPNQKPPKPEDEFVAVTEEELNNYKKGNISPERAAGLADDVDIAFKDPTHIEKVKADDKLYGEMLQDAFNKHMAALENQKLRDVALSSIGELIGKKPEEVLLMIDPQNPAYNEKIASEFKNAFEVLKQQYKQETGNDIEDTTGVSSKVGGGKESEQAKSEQGTGEEETGNGGVVQAAADEVRLSDIDEMLADDDNFFKDTGDRLLSPEERQDLEQERQRITSASAAPTTTASPTGASSAAAPAIQTTEVAPAVEDVESVPVEGSGEATTTTTPTTTTAETTTKRGKKAASVAAAETTPEEKPQPTKAIKAGDVEVRKGKTHATDGVYEAVYNKKVIGKLSYDKKEKMWVDESGDKFAQKKDAIAKFVLQYNMKQKGQETPTTKTEGNGKAAPTAKTISYPMEEKGKWYGDENYKERGGRLVKMSPDEFLSRTKELVIDEEARDNINNLKEHIKNGGKLDPLAIYLVDKTKSNNSDGRHRAIAAKELGIKEVPVLDFTTRATKVGVEEKGSVETTTKPATIAEEGKQEALPTSIQQAYGRRATLRMTAEALQKQMGGKKLTGKSQKELDAVNSEIAQLDNLINTFEKERAKQRAAKAKTEQTSEKKETKAEENPTTLVGGTVKGMAYGIYLIDKLIAIDPQGRKSMQGYIDAWNSITKTHGDSNKANSFLEDILVGMMPADKKATAYSDIREGFKKELAGETTTETKGETKPQTPKTNPFAETVRKGMEALMGAIGSKVKMNFLSPEEAAKIAAMPEKKRGKLLFQTTAWHGGPYKFSKFLSKQINTGEKAQAFGWGLYFTDLKGIAEYYSQEVNKQDRQSDIDLLKSIEVKNYYDNGKSANLYDALQEDYSNTWEEIDKLYVSIINPLLRKQKDLIPKFYGELSPPTQKAILENRELLQDIGEKYVYKVTLFKGKKRYVIAPIKSSDGRWNVYDSVVWDKIQAMPITETQGILDDFTKEKPEKRFATKEQALEWIENNNQYTWLEWDKPVGANAIAKINKALEEKGIPATPKKYFMAGVNGRVVNGMTGEEVYRELSKILGDNVKIGGSKEASLFLLENGIDGVKYPAKSIATGITSDTARDFNYVVFDENAITIDERNGETIPIQVAVGYRGIRGEYRADYNGIQYFAVNERYAKVFGNNIIKASISTDKILDLDKYNKLLESKGLNLGGQKQGFFTIDDSIFDENGNFTDDSMLGRMGRAKSQIGVEEFNKIYDQFVKEFNNADVIYGEDIGNPGEKVYAVKNPDAINTNNVDAAAPEGVQYMKTPDGKILGFVQKLPDGSYNVYINPETQDAETPVHEIAGHIFLPLIKESNPELYNQGTALIQNSEYMGKANGDIAEALALAVGDKGKLLAEKPRKGFMEWLKGMWEWVGDKLRLNPDKIKNLTLGQFTDLIAGSVLKGKELAGTKPTETTEAKPTSTAAPAKVPSFSEFDAISADRGKMKEAKAEFIAKHGQQAYDAMKEITANFTKITKALQEKEILTKKC